MLNFRGGETERLEMRLDTAVFQRGLTDSREKARNGLFFCISGQLAARLAADGRVVNMEQTDARTLTRESFAVPPDFCSVDVSFISLEHIVPPLAARFDCRFVTLVKPQFEAGRADIGKRGVVKSAAAHERVLRAFHAMLGQSGLFLSGLIPSPVRGGDGNAEYLAAFSRETSDFMPDIRAVVRSALA